MDDVSLDLEMDLRMFFRSLLWEVVGSDFANRAVSSDHNQGGNCGFL